MKGSLSLPVFFGIKLSISSTRALIKVFTREESNDTRLSLWIGFYEDLLVPATGIPRQWTFVTILNARQPGSRLSKKTYL